MLVYITPCNPLRYSRPLLVTRALSNIKVYDSRALVQKYSPRPISRIRSAKRITSGLGVAFSLLKLKAQAAIILNSLGVFESKLLCNIPIVLDYMDVFLKKDLRLTFYDKLAVESADAIIFWSRALMKIISSRYKIKKSCYIPQGVDLKTFNPPKIGGKLFRQKYGIKDKFIVCWSGGIWRNKKTGEDYQGSDKLPELFKLIHRELGNKVAFVVNCPKDPTLFKMFRDANINITWVKPMKYNAPLRQSMYAAADIVVLPATTYPTVYYAERLKLFEYLASWSGIVAEKTPGVSSILRDKHNARLVPLNNTEKFAHAVTELYENRDLLEKLKRNAYTDAHQYDWSILVTKYRQFVSNTLSK